MPAFTLSRAARRGVLGAATAALVAGGALAVAPTASAYATSYFPITCSGVNVRANHTTSSAIVGMGFRGDKDLVSKVYYLTKPYNMERSWLYGTVTRKSDGRKVTGWVTSSCLNLRV
jgi:hypothetical protein